MQMYHIVTIKDLGRGEQLLLAIQQRFYMKLRKFKMTSTVSITKILWWSSGHDIIIVLRCQFDGSSLSYLWDWIIFSPEKCRFCLGTGSVTVELGGDEKEVSRCINCEGVGSLTCTTCQGTGIQPRYLDRRYNSVHHYFLFLCEDRVCSED